jgi:acyl carrier protein phosphodiesterase
MNFLAHAYLAGENEGMIVGNLMADAVNRKQFELLPLHLQKGVLHHRQIDRYTDSHPLVIECRSYFFPHIRHYAAVMVDVIFDHYLAKHWQNYHHLPLTTFEDDTYRKTLTYESLFSEKFRFMFSRMSAHRWLSNYAKYAYLNQTITNLQHRTPLFTHAIVTNEILQEKYENLEHHFFDFFKDLSNELKQ